MRGEIIQIEVAGVQFTVVIQDVAETGCSEWWVSFVDGHYVQPWRQEAAGLTEAEETALQQAVQDYLEAG